MKPPTGAATFFSSFRFRLFAIFTSVTLLVTAIFVSYRVFSEIRLQRDQATAHLRMLAANLAERIPLPLFAEDKEALSRMTRDAVGIYGVYSVTVTKRNNVMLELRQPRPLPDDKLISVTAPVFSNPLAVSPEDALTGRNERMGTRIGTVRLEMSAEKLQQNARRFVMSALVLSFLYWITVSLLCYLALRRVTRSFKTLMEGLETMRSGNLAVKVRVEDDDEAGRAAMAVNELGAALLEREAENRRLNAELLGAMQLEVREEKKWMMAKLIETNRMTSLGLLASSMAHEINNPNASIRLAGQYLARAWKDAMPLLQQTSLEEGDFALGGVPFSVARDKVNECNVVIERNTKRISQVVEDLRSYSLGKSNQLHPGVNVNSVINSAMTIIRSHVKHTETIISTDLDGNIPLITASYHQLEQVAINLMLNAVQAVPDGKGKIVVKTLSDRERGEVSISVSDDGEGIKPEVREKLLEPFFSTRIEKNGSGLGLFVANFIVTAHNGRLVFDSTPGRGTTVTVHLPITPPAQSA